MSKRALALKQERHDLAERLKALDAAAEAEGRAMTDAESAEFDAAVESIKRLDAEIERIRQMALTAPVTHAAISGGHDRAIDRPWESMGEFLQAVAAAQSPGGTTDPRLFQAGPSGMNSATPSEGGFLVRKDWSDELIQRGVDRAVLAPRCRTIPIGMGADGLEAPYVDETSRVTGSRWGGVQVYRRAEADTVAASKPKFGLFDLRLEDLMAIGYATDRLLRDAIALQAVLSDSFEEEFAWKLDYEIYRGSGVGECLGMLTSGSPLATVSKETGQGAATVVSTNLFKMYARMPERLIGGAIWVYNRGLLPQLFEFAIQVGVGGAPIFIPAGASGSPYNTFLGIPMVSLEQAPAVGTVGDIALVNPREYILITKGGVQADESMHVRFIYGERTFRWVYPINGRPKDRSVITPADGSSNTLAPFVALETRS